VNAAALDATIPVLRAAAPEALSLGAGTLITGPLWHQAARMTLATAKLFASVATNKRQPMVSD